ncbi:hypothetical protein [Psychrobacter frigidicola]|uniref:hypothetical protein n=1 Tax=Psychrobacter frigidicola TaxID=45611 RepID=UPI001919D232|nr:hypothetical protein [Psychrobacter frigidicola]
MAKRLIGILIISAASVWALTGCDNSVDTIDSTSKEVTEQTTTPESSKDGISATKDSASANTIDWSAIASDETAATLANYDYPFALDSQSVHAYADYFKIDNVSAQHNLTVGMASNEALSKALDAIGTSYVSHELTDGDKVELIIHTTPDISASRYDYVLADDFAKGLILPIVIKPDGKKGGVNLHEGS